MNAPGMVSAQRELPLADEMMGTEMRQSAWRQQGFTLIELMIVVAVLSIVAALAIPNFLRYQAKSRQAEARTNLGGIFIAETSFYGEQTRYGSFREVGFNIAGVSNRYNYGGPLTGGNGGNNAACTPSDPNSNMMNEAGDCIAAGVGIREEDPGPGSSGAVVNSRDASAGEPSFTAAAWANLDSDSGRDRWYVNDIKQNLSVADRDDVSG